MTETNEVARRLELRRIALDHQAAGRLEEAEAGFRRLVELEPANADVASNLGIVLFLRNRLAEAEACFGRAVALKPDHADGLNNLGLMRKRAGASAEAVALFRRALAARPTHPDALNNLGVVLSTLGEAEEAIAVLQRAIECAPRSPEAHNNLGMALSAANRDAEAIERFHQAIALRPAYPEAHSNLGAALRKEGRIEESIAALQQALALRPNYPEGLVNLGLALREKGELERAIACYEAAIAGQPSLVTAHWNLALLRLLRGEWRAGWPGYEWRFQRERGDRPRPYEQPRLTLDAPAGSTVLVYAEQGFGDTIQFARYIPLLRARGYKVVFEVQPALRRLLSGIAGVTTLAKGSRLPAFDRHIPLLSLPGLFETTIDTVPGGGAAYLRVSPGATMRWRAQLRGSDHRPFIGIAWRGNPSHQNDRNRSLSAAAFAPILAGTGCRFVSLQKDARTDELEALRAHGALDDPTAGFKDFADTARAISALDLVISVDSAVAHLAGALGAPVWVLLPHAPDWRWLLERWDSPWYARARLFRQNQARDWTGVVAEIAAGLRRLAATASGEPISRAGEKG